MVSLYNNSLWHELSKAEIADPDLVLLACPLLETKVQTVLEGPKWSRNDFFKAKRKKRTSKRSYIIKEICFEEDQICLEKVFEELTVVATSACPACS